MEAVSSIFALNNMAVVMMVQGDFQHAASTLKDSLAMVKAILSNQSSYDRANFSYQVHEKSRAASVYLSRMRPKCTEMDQYLRMTAVESNDLQSLRSASDERSSVSCFPILIREPQMKDGNIDHEAGILLYNYGLSCYLLAAYPEMRKEGSSRFVNKNDPLFSDAHRAFISANAIFLKQISQNEEDGSVHENIESIYCALLVLSCASKLFTAKDEKAMASEADEAIEELQVVVDEDYVTNLSMPQQVGAPAA